MTIALYYQTVMTSTHFFFFVYLGYVKFLYFFDFLNSVAKQNSPFSIGINMIVFL